MSETKTKDGFYNTEKEMEYFSDLKIQVKQVAYAGYKQQWGIKQSLS